MQEETKTACRSRASPIRNMRTGLKRLLSAPVREEDQRRLESLGFAPEEICSRLLIAEALKRKAEEGDMRAITTVLGLTGESLETTLETRERRGKVRKLELEVERMSREQAEEAHPENDLLEQLLRAVEGGDYAVSMLQSEAGAGDDLVGEAVPFPV